MSIKNLVILFFNKGKSVYQGLPFLNSVRNKIYVLKIGMLELAMMARKHKIDFGSKFSILGTDVLSI
jgi:hypothetical protein